MSHHKILNGYARYRLRMALQPAVMFPVRSTGMYEVDSHWCQIPQIGNFLELFWMVSGACEFVIDGVKYVLHPHEVCFYFPGDEHLERAVANHTRFYWLCIAGDHIPELISSFNIRRQPFFAGQCPIYLFAGLSQDICDSSLTSVYLAGAKAFEILSMALMGRDVDPQGNKYVNEFKVLLRDIFADSNCTTELMATKLGMHRATLHRLVSLHTGLPPSQHISFMRIHHAIELLESTHMTVEAIALACGFSSLAYFAKVFRKHTMMSPSEFRRRR